MRGARCVVLHLTRARCRPENQDVVIWRAAAAWTAVAAVAVGVSACGSDSNTRQIAALDAAQRNATQTCSKAGAPTGFDGATLAKTVVVDLRWAGMSPHPWDAVSPVQVVTFCYPIDAIHQSGVYLDSSGNRSTAPSASQMKH